MLKVIDDLMELLKEEKIEIDFSLLKEKVEKIERKIK